MIAACMTGTAILSWSKTSFNGLNWARKRMRSNRCASVSVNGGWLLAGALVSVLLSIGCPVGNDSLNRLTGGNTIIIVERSGKVHESFGVVLGCVLSEKFISSQRATGFAGASRQDCIGILPD